MEYILRLNEVQKNYGDYEALKKITFSVPKGSIFGLLGPNGAGKTSLIRIITTITQADAGKVEFLGESIHPKHIRSIGYLPEERGLYKQMKVGEQLLYLAQLKGMPEREARQKIQFWMERFDIVSWWGKKVQELSKGMQQKVQFISTVLHEPELLILDEPFSGLDPINTNLIRDEIHRLNEKGTTIIFSTHRMEQVEEICEEIVLINRGSIILEGNVRELKQRFRNHQFRMEFANEVGGPLAEAGDFRQIQSSRYTVTLQGKETSTFQDLLENYGSYANRLLKVEELLPSLNEIFIQQVESNNNE